MPDQEEYLDNLLKNLSADDNSSDRVDSKGDGNSAGNSQNEDLIHVDNLDEISEEDIDRLLAMDKSVNIDGNNDTDEASSSKNPSDDSVNYEADLMDLLNSANNDDSQEIHDLLQKSDQNEAVDDDIVSLLQNVPDEEDPVAKLEESIAENNSDDLAEQPTKDSKALKKKKKAEEKAAKKAEKQAKKAEKLARKQKNAEPTVEQNAELDINQEEGADSLQKEEKNISQSTDLEEVEQDKLLDADTVQEDADSQMADMDELLEAANSSNEEQTTQKKKGFFAKILDFLTEEDEDPIGEEEIQLSDENRAILQELADKKGKKQKGKKAKGSKKADSKENATEDGQDKEEADNQPGKKGNKKPKKAKKPKKEKEPKNSEIAEKEKGPKLSPKKIIPILLVCLTLGVVLIVISDLSGDYSAKKEGRQAFYEGNYQTCYKSLYGKNLNESEQVMFNKSESILRIRLWIREYEMFAEQGQRAEGLDSLIQSVQAYPTLYSYASSWNAGSEVQEGYQQILDILSDEYGLSEEQALEIAAIPNDADYSKRIYDIVDGTTSDNGMQDAESEDVIEIPDDENDGVLDRAEEQLPDLLPEEEGLSNEVFVDNGISE